MKNTFIDVVLPESDNDHPRVCFQSCPAWHKPPGFLSQSIAQSDSEVGMLTLDMAPFDGIDEYIAQSGNDGFSPSHMRTTLPSTECPHHSKPEEVWGDCCLFSLRNKPCLDILRYGECKRKLKGVPCSFCHDHEKDPLRARPFKHQRSQKKKTGNP